MKWIKRLFKLLKLFLIISGLMFWYQYFGMEISVEYRQEEIEVVQCISGDTFVASLGENEYVVELEYITTPDNNETSIYGQEAANYTCDQLNQADRVEIEYKRRVNDESDSISAWVWLYDSNDNEELLQANIAKRGYVVTTGSSKHENSILVDESIIDTYNLYEGKRENNE